jgi:hypothetical protein
MERLVGNFGGKWVRRWVQITIGILRQKAQDKGSILLRSEGEKESCNYMRTPAHSGRNTWAPVKRSVTSVPQRSEGGREGAVGEKRKGRLGTHDGPSETPGSR